MPDNDARYAVGDLAALGGVSRRTVRYYVQEGLIPPPTGLGRGHHYGPGHLDALLRVKAMQESGQTLDDIRRSLQGRSGPVGRTARSRSPSPALPPAEPAPAHSLWQRVSIAAGVEVHIASGRPLPSPAALLELRDWCRRHLAPPNHDVDRKNRD